MLPIVYNSKINYPRDKRTCEEACEAHDSSVYYPQDAKLVSYHDGDFKVLFLLQL